MRAAIAVCDAGQAAARAHAAAGISELELWAERARRDGERRGDPAAGARRPRLGPAHCRDRRPSGHRGPSRTGDLVLCDLVPRVAGYWGDSCATFAVGEPSAAAREAHARRRATCSPSSSRRSGPAPSPPTWTLWRAQRLEFPHHTGHGLGTGFHEEPRIVPGSTHGARGRDGRRDRARHVRRRRRAARADPARHGRRVRGALRSRPEPLTAGGTGLRRARRGRKMEIQSPKEG